MAIMLERAAPDPVGAAAAALVEAAASSALPYTPGGLHMMLAEEVARAAGAEVDHAAEAAWHRAAAAELEAHADEAARRRPGSASAAFLRASAGLSREMARHHEAAAGR